METLDRPSWNAGGRQCTANNHAGERCRRRPIAGGSVCVCHGGSTPAVREAAKLRLLAMVEPILSVFEEVVEHWRGTRCETCGRPTGDPYPVLRIGQMVLDRSGFHPTLTVEHAAPPPDEYGSLTEDEMLLQMQAKVDRAQQMIDNIRQRRDARLTDAEDGFIVPDDVEQEPIQDAAVQFPTGNVTPDECNAETTELPKETSDE